MFAGPELRGARRLFFAVLGFGILIALGTAGYRALEAMDLFDAFYMTVITISTVGFGEIKPLSPSGRVLTMGLILGSAGLAAYALSIIGDLIASGEWRAWRENRKRARMLNQLDKHVIVCGYGRVGRHVAHALELEKIPFIVLDKDANLVAHINKTGYLGLLGNAANELTLKQAGIERARGLVAAVDSDAENVFIVLTARALRSDLLIIARVNYEDSESKLLRAGANHLILPYRIAGRQMVSWLARPAVAGFLDQVAHAGGLDFLLEQVRLASGSSLVGQTLAQAQLQNRFGITVLACRDANGNWNASPGAETVLGADAEIIALGTREQLQELMKLARG
ncbi:MAG: NAD-binding protein [Chloroflexi bacterium]|nr:NAD-binding protein [Chloroflexota bacterium]